MIDWAAMSSWCVAHRRGGRGAWCAVVAGLLAAMGAVAASANTIQVDVQDGNGKPVADAVVFLDSADARKLAKPLAGVEMAQEKKQFVPGVLVVPVGTQVLFPNRDSVRHHVYSFSPAKKFELKLYTGTPSSPVLFDTPGVVVLGCNIHDQMVGWILVVETPYYARSAAANGRAQIDNIPPGNYTLRVWHARQPVGAPAVSQPLNVAAAGTGPILVRMTGLVP